MTKRFLFILIILSFSSAALLTASQRSKVVVANQTNSTVAVNTTTVVLPQTKATIVTTLTSLPSKLGLSDMQKAIILRDENKVNQLLRSGFIPDDKTIVFAMDNNLSDMTILELALKARFSLDHEFSNKMTLSRLALKSAYKDKSLLFYLLEHGVSFRNEKKLLETVGSYCCDYQSKKDGAQLVQAFLKHGHDALFILNSNIWRQFCLFYSDKEYIYLNDESVKLLLQAGFRPNDCFSYNDRSITLLFLAIQICDESIVEKMIACGSDVNFLSDGQDSTYDNVKRIHIPIKITPLSMALEFRKNGCRDPKNDKIVETLIKHGAVL